MPENATSNEAIISMLNELIELTTLDEESPQAFRVRAYEKAKIALEAHHSDIAGMTKSQLTKIDGVGNSTAAKIAEFVNNGSVDKLEGLREKYPPEFVRLSKIPGLGPKSLKLLRSKLNIHTVDDLKAAIDQKQLRDLPRFGAASETKLAKSIERLGLAGKDRRTPIGSAIPIARSLVKDLGALHTVTEVAYGGSLRRMSETIGDIDITVAADDPASVMDFLSGHRLNHQTLLAGETKTSFLTRDGLQVDVRVVAGDEYGAALLYFTGSKAHNIALRQRALSRGYLLSEYGLFQDDKRIASATETEIYRALEMDYVEPPMREDTGEMQATSDDLKTIIQLSDIRGDLHYHTDRSGDGRSSLTEMVAEAAERGYEYLAITDHGEDLAINGSSMEEMIAHEKQIRIVQESYPKMQILYGCELNIGAEGGLDYDPDFRATFDYTVASVHSHFDLTKAKQTERIIRAIEDPTVDSIGHLTGRYIGQRPGIELDIDPILDALKHYDVALEVNGALKRLDASYKVVRAAVEREVKLVVNTDSHHTSELGRMEYGVATAQKGWAPARLVINTWPKKKFLKWVDRHRA